VGAAAAVAVVAGVAGAVVVVVVVDELLPHPLTKATGANRNNSTILRMTLPYPYLRQSMPLPTASRRGVGTEPPRPARGPRSFARAGHDSQYERLSRSQSRPPARNGPALLNLARPIAD
jgi:hypothetical protein